jgi:Mg-chelatase subunit ChlD
MNDLELKILLDRAKVPTANAETELKCLVKIWPSRELVQQAEPLRTSVCLVFDCSASMLLNNKLNTAIDAAKLIVETLSEIQRVSLVAFQSKVRVLVPESEATGACKQQINEQIDEIRAMTGGSTNMTDGLKAGLGILAQSPAEAKVMILLSDGAADFPETAERAAQAATAGGVQLFAVGIGDQYNAEHL